MTRLRYWKKYLLFGFIIVLSLMKLYWNTTRTCKGPHCEAEVNDDQLSLDYFNQFNDIPQNDPGLVRVIRSNHLFPPSKSDNFLFKFINIEFKSDRVSKVEHILTRLSPGFFIECGALDGLIASNTIWLERSLGWTGLLIEANPKDFKALSKMKRNAWISNLCLSSRPYPNKVNFYLAPEKGGLPGVAGLVKREQYNTVPIEVQCVPLYSLLVALNKTTIDMFSIDIEGTELEMLKTVPFDKVIFKVLIIENAFIPGGHKELAKFLEPKGYIFHSFAPSEENPWDSLFIHESIQDLI